MAMSKGNFFSENKTDKPHELIKRVMYKKYVQAYIPVTQKYYSTVIIDGFAGPGRYGPGWPATIEEYGSPLIALIVAVEYLVKKHKQIDIKFAFDLVPDIKVKTQSTSSRFNPKADITLYFVEDNKRHFRQLCKNVEAVFDTFLHQIDGTEYLLDEGDGIAEYQFSISFGNGSKSFLTCKIENKKVQDFIPPMIDTEKTRCLTFLDPFGYTQIPMEVLQGYVGIGREVFINFMSSFVNRFVSRNPSGVAGLFGIETNKMQNVLRQYGKTKEEVGDIIADFVKNIVRQSQHEAETSSVTNITKNYEKILRQKAGSDFSLIFEIKGKNNATIYHLVFITNHIKGVQEMKESMNRCTQEEKELGMSDYKIVRLGHELSLKNDQNPEDVADVIFQRFEGETVMLEEVEKFVWLDTPFVFRKGALGLMEKEENPRICQVCNINQGETRIRRAFKLPDWGRWKLQFRNDESPDTDCSM